MKTKTLQQKSSLSFERRRIKKFFDGLGTRGGIVNGKAILFVYNEEAPELSYILVEPL